jgi:hypothetical protein
MRCANPDCPNPTLISDRIVQIAETQRTLAGASYSTFAAVACSKKCAVAILTPLIAVEEAEQVRLAAPFGPMPDEML